MDTLVIHGSMDKYPWNLDMMMETFTHVQYGFPWKQDGFPWKLNRIYTKTR